MAEGECPKVLEEGAVGCGESAQVDLLRSSVILLPLTPDELLA